MNVDDLLICDRFAAGERCEESTSSEQSALFADTGAGFRSRRFARLRSSELARDGPDRLPRDGSGDFGATLTREGPAPDHPETAALNG